MISLSRLTALTQPAHGEFLEAKQDAAMEKVYAAERVARKSSGKATEIQDEARQQQKDAIALAEEWGCLDGGRA